MTWDRWRELGIGLAWLAIIPVATVVALIVLPPLLIGIGLCGIAGTLTGRGRRASATGSNVGGAR